MKVSLISAVSTFALAAACGTPAQAYVLIATPEATNLFDLVQALDITTPAPDGAATALRTASGLPPAGFTGPVDQSALAGTAFPLVPLGATPGTPQDDDFALQLAGTWHWNAWQKALAIGVARIAPLIGIISDGPAPGEKPGSTVFIAQAGFGDGSVSGARRRPTAASAFGPSSTSTATITLTGAATLRQPAGNGFSVAAPIDAQSMPAASDPAPADTEPPPPLYRYAPQPGPGTKPNLVAAGFSNAMTTSPEAAMVYRPVARPGTGARRAGSLPSNEAAAVYARLLDVTASIDNQPAATGPDGTRTFLPASVSANPGATAAGYVMSVLDAAPGRAIAPSIEAFQIGPGKTGNASGAAATSVADPLRGKIMAGVGPLDNSLALP